MLSDRLTYSILAAITAAFVGIGALYAINTPAWQSPDEPAHYNYIAQIADHGCCPVIQSGDWNAATLDTLKAEQFPEGANLAPIQYEDHQPPLYYLLATPIFEATNGNLVALRLVSVFFGAGMILAAYWAVARMFPRRKTLALAAAAFAAFVPQHVAMMASVNNDGLAELLLGLAVVVSVTYLGNPTFINHDGQKEALSISSRPHASALGGLAGLAFLTKLTVYLPAALAVAVAIIVRWRQEKHPTRWLIEQTAWAAGSALALGAVWWVRDIVVYGWPDFVAQRAHDMVVVGQLRTTELIAQVGFGRYVGQFLTTTFHSFWGQFGWMAVPMPPRVYLLLGVFAVGAVAGLGLLFTLFRERARVGIEQRAGEWVLVAVALATLFNYLYYNLTFVQFQGRYLFTALIPIGAAVAAGLWGWELLLERWLGTRSERLLKWLPPLGCAWLGALALVALFKYVMPFLG